MFRTMAKAPRGPAKDFASRRKLARLARQRVQRRPGVRMMAGVMSPSRLDKSSVKE